MAYWSADDDDDPPRTTSAETAPAGNRFSNEISEVVVYRRLAVKGAVRARTIRRTAPVLSEVGGSP